MLFIKSVATCNNDDFKMFFEDERVQNSTIINLNVRFLKFKIQKK